MKKILSTVAALGLVVGFAATASALDVPQKVETTSAPAAVKPTAPGVDLFSVTGSWSLAGAWLSDKNDDGYHWKPALHDDSNENVGTVWLHSFILKPTLRVNDKISVMSEVRFSDRNVFGDDDLTESASMSGAHDGGRDVDVKHLYMEYASPYGKVRIGRTPAGAWGDDFISNSAEGNRIMWWTNFLPEGWGMLLFTQKMDEDDWTSSGSSDDKDAYYADLSYKGSYGKSTLAYWHVQDNGLSEDVTSQDIWFHGVYNIANFSINTELDYAFGEASTTMDAKAYAFMIDGAAQFGDLNVGLLYFRLSGDDDGDSDEEAFMALKGNGTGKDFNPYQILTGDYMGILNPDRGPVSSSRINSTIEDAGVQSVGLHASYKASDRLTLSGIVGTAWTLEEVGIDDHFGWEFDLGASYKVMDNLTYGAHFGYLATGDLFEDLTGENSNDIVFLAHQLTLTF